MFARIAQDLGVGGVIGVFDRDDGFSKLRVFVAQIGGEFLLGLRRADQQNLMGTAQGLRDVIEEMMVRRGLVTAVSTLAAVDTLVLILRTQFGFFLLGGREVPGGCFLVIYPNDGVIV
jgi:hypothetical protein